MSSQPYQPLAEVFGFPVHNTSATATDYRSRRLCPFNNKAPECTKDRLEDPLGVCSVYESGRPVITCPIRFRQDWAILEHAARFFFTPGTTWHPLEETRIEDADGLPAGNIDFVLASVSEGGQVLNFGALEVQAVYISGNVRRPFASYIEDNARFLREGWSRTSVRPDYLSSSRKRLAPQLLYKGSILKSWGKRMAVALQNRFFETLPSLPEVNPDQADIAWLIYDLVDDPANRVYNLKLEQTVYTAFSPALERITVPQPGSLSSFVELLQRKLYGQV